MFIDSYFIYIFKFDVVMYRISEMGVNFLIVILVICWFFVICDVCLFGMWFIYVEGCGLMLIFFVIFFGVSKLLRFGGRWVIYGGY